MLLISHLQQVQVVQILQCLLSVFHEISEAKPDSPPWVITVQCWDFFSKLLNCFELESAKMSFRTSADFSQTERTVHYSVFLRIYKKYFKQTAIFLLLKIK